MKTFILILLFTIYSPQVKQYKLVSVVNEKEEKLTVGYIAITKDTLYWRENRQHAAFAVDTVIEKHGIEMTFVKRDTLINGEKVLVYFGVCAVNEEAKAIIFQLVNPSCGCQATRKYRFK